MGDKEQILNPCPFCGSTDVGGAGGIVSCYSCPATISVQNTNTFYAGELWNRRKERDSLQSQLSEATTRIERMENLFFLAMDFIDKHPADPDISKDQTEAWLKILNSNAMDEFARLRQQTKEYPDERFGVVGSK